MGKEFAHEAFQLSNRVKTITTLPECDYEQHVWLEKDHSIHRNPGSKGRGIMQCDTPQQMNFIYGKYTISQNKDVIFTKTHDLFLPYKGSFPEQGRDYTFESPNNPNSKWTT